MANMNPEIKARWVAALRSGEYKQGKKTLRTASNEFCCLGVLCNLHAQAHPRIAAQQTDPTQYLGASGFLPKTVAMWAGIGNDDKQVRIGARTTWLSSHNDTGCTFAQIADAIEVQL